METLFTISILLFIVGLVGSFPFLAGLIEPAAGAGNSTLPSPIATMFRIIAIVSATVAIVTALILFL